MDTINDSRNFTENQSLQVITEMIQVSRNKFRKDGILFIIWGWLLFYNSLQGFITRRFLIVFPYNKIIKYVGMVLLIAGLAYTIYYLIKQSKRVQTYIGVSLRYVWISLFVSMILVNLIIFKVTNNVNFDLQHPIFMVLMAFAVTITGGILRQRIFIFGGVIFGVLAYLASFVSLDIQLLIEAGAWLLVFIIPGHIIFAQRDKQ